MEIIKIDGGQKEATYNFGSDELEIISLWEGAENEQENYKNIAKKEENGNTTIKILPAFLFDEDRRYTKEDLKYNFLALKWTAWLKLSPLGVDEDSNNFPRFRSSHKSWWRNGISLVWFLIAAFRTFIGVLSTVYFGMTGNPVENLGQMTMLLINMTNGCIMMYSMSCYVSVSQTLAPFLLSIFKYLHNDAEPGSELQQKKNKGEQNKFRFGFRVGRHTLKELLIIHLPFLIYPMSAVVPLLMVIDPSFPLLLVSLVPPEISFSFLSVAVFDSVIFVYYYMILHMDFYIFMGMHRIQEEAGLALKHLKIKITARAGNDNEEEKEDSIKLETTLKSLGLLHIWTRFFNRSFSGITYSTKLIGLTGSIFGGFGLIKMIQIGNAGYAGILGLIFFEGILLYNLVFGRAFEIPEKIEELKREIRKQSFKIYKNKENLLERKYVDKYLRSIPWLGVKDGVYKMERLTCLNFISFAVEQISSLVLAY